MVLEREVASDPFSSPTGADALRRLPPGSSWQVAEDRLAGLRADPAKSSLAAYHRVDATPAVGTEFPASSGIQLSKLTDQQVEDLALLVAERGVVFFREQDITEEQQRTLGAKLGPLHVHPIGRSSDKEREEFQEFEFGSESKAVAGEGWHTDISFEEKPSAYAILKLTEVPPNGGDTLWVSTYAAYDKLTPAYRRILEGLEAYHTNAHRHYASLSDASLGASGARAPILRRGPNTALHPVVRTHPLTKWKSLYVNQGFTTQIKGFSKGESDSLLAFLYEHLQSEDFKVRFKWTKNTVAIWDNRATQHLAVWDYFPHRRKGTRVVAVGERPYFDPAGSKSQAEEAGSQYKQNPSWSRSVL